MVLYAVLVLLPACLPACLPAPPEGQHHGRAAALSLDYRCVGKEETFKKGERSIYNFDSLDHRWRTQGPSGRIWPSALFLPGGSAELLAPR